MEKEYTMKLDLPEPIASYLAADKTNDGPLLARCFTPDARVHDEAHDYQGLAAILAWKQESSAKYQYAVEPLTISTAGRSVTLHARLTGSFPGSPAELDYLFTLSGDKIAVLEIK